MAAAAKAKPPSTVAPNPVASPMSVRLPIRYFRAMAEAPQPPRPDRLARSGAIAIAAARIGIGIGAFALTRPALRALGFDEPDGTSVALARLAGGRDIALGVHGLIVRDDAARLREATLLGAVVDAGDAIAFGAALAGRDGIDRTSWMNLPIAGSAVIAGAWVAARLGGPATEGPEGPEPSGI